MEYYDNILNNQNKPLFDSEISEYNHKIFYKYTSKKYYKYLYELLATLCKNGAYENRCSVFNLSLYFALKFLYFCENTAHLSNFDLLILNCFSLGLKSMTKQKQFLSISKLKSIYDSKYEQYKKIDIITSEIVCIKVIGYNLNILTPNDYIIYFSNGDLKLQVEALNELQKLIYEDINNYIFKYPMNLARECLIKVHNKIINKEPLSYGFKKISNNVKIMHRINKNNNFSTSVEDNINLTNNSTPLIYRNNTKKYIIMNKKSFYGINLKKYNKIFENNINTKCCVKKSEDNTIYRKKNNYNKHLSFSTISVDKKRKNKNYSSQTISINTDKLNKISQKKIILKKNLFHKLNIKENKIKNIFISNKENNKSFINNTKNNSPSESRIFQKPFIENNEYMKSFIINKIKNLYSVKTKNIYLGALNEYKFKNIEKNQLQKYFAYQKPELSLHSKLNTSINNLNDISACSNQNYDKSILNI